MLCLISLFYHGIKFCKYRLLLQMASFVNLLLIFREISLPYLKFIHINIEHIYTHTHNLFMSLGVQVYSGVLMHGTASCSSQRTTWMSVFSSSIMQFMGFVVRLGIKCLCPLRNLSHPFQSYIYYWYLSREIYFNFLKMPHTHTHIVSLGHICPQLLTSNNLRSLNNDV